MAMITSEAIMETEFAKWLRIQIAEIPSTISAFANLVGVEEATLHRWFKSQSPHIRPYNVSRIAKALGVPRQVVQEKLDLHTPPGRSGKHGVSSEPLPVAQSTAGAAHNPARAGKS
jgi:hypothetical protein